MGRTHRLKESEIKLLRRIFGLKRDEMIRGWRGERNACSILVGKVEETSRET
jgi:hypothetical protein